MNGLPSPVFRAGLLVCASVIALTACGGKGDEKKQAAAPPPQATSTLTAEQIAEMKAIPDLSCEKCPPKAEVAKEEKVSDVDVLKAIDANKDASALYASAGKLGYGTVRSGLKTTYTDGSVVESALIGGDEKGVAILASRSGSASDSVLIRLDPANPDRLIVTDSDGGSATVSFAGQLIDSQETHNSCHYWHCVGAAVSWVYTSTWYGDLLGAFCKQCAEDMDEVTCGVCLASLPSGLLASTATCGIDSCDFCLDDSCGDDVVKSTQCRVDPATVGEGLTPIYGIYRTVDDYSCDNAGLGDSQCIMAANVVTRTQVCPGNCAADGVSCAPAAPHVCDPTACAAQREVTSTGSCISYWIGPPGKRMHRYAVTWTGTPWSCQPDGAGGSVCVPGATGTFMTNCPNGCNAGDTTCPGEPATSSTATATSTRTPTATATRTPPPTHTPGPSPTRTKTPKPYIRK